MGRLVYPRQTGASTFYYIGENQQIPSSQPTSGDLILQAKKGAVLIQCPNELFRYASVSVEMFLRQDMTKVIGLGMDKALLEGRGGSNSPKGLINYANITSYTSTGTPADANSGYPLQPADIYKMIAKVEEANAVFRAWVMKPLEFAYIANMRSAEITAGDGQGPFMFNIIRTLNESFGLERTQVGNLSGYPVHKSTNISGSRTRGSGTTQNTYILGGDFTDYIVAVAPTIEFAMTQQGDTAFQNDQTWIRAILPHDGAPRHEASFVFADNLLY
jgi:HK97 family phage major capsid protein